MKMEMSNVYQHMFRSIYKLSEIFLIDQSKRGKKYKA